MAKTEVQPPSPFKEMSERLFKLEVPVQILKPATGFDLNELWKEDPAIYEILRTSSTVEEARRRLFDYLNELEWDYFTGKRVEHPLIEATAHDAIKVFRNIISPRNEVYTGFSALSYLWRIARGDEKALEEVDVGFLLEFKHLFKAINARPDIYPAKYAEGLPYVDFRRMHGRQAGIARSNYLDMLARRMAEYLNKYPTGLDPEVIELRKKNKQRILEYFGGTEDDWWDYKWHFKNVLKGTKGLRVLKDLTKIPEEYERSIELAVKFKVPFGISPYYLHLFDLDNPGTIDYQPRSQVLPPLHTVSEIIAHRDEREYYFDFMGEHDTSPHPLITRRYPMVAIIKASNTCPQICVYCQRNWEIETALDPRGVPSKKNIDDAIDWFAEHPEIKDILITGGDPFVLSDDFLIDHIVKRFAELDHIMHIRIGTRVLVTVPMRISEETAEKLGSYIEPGKRNVTVVTHVESASEVTPEMATAVERLKKNGMYVYNQQVFTFWVSRRFETVKLRMALKKVGIDPYYSFYTKGKWETKDYVIPVARIQQERKEEARLLPGTFRTDEPVFNVPRLGKNHLRAWQDHELIMIRPDGRRVYLWHPWEKYIQLVDPYVYTDIVSIRMYLDKLQEVFGEDPEDYKSIWYYY
jgi:lysine 2,3-aminomutase